MQRATHVGAPAALALFAVFGAAQSVQPAAVSIVTALGVVMAGTLIAWWRLTGWPLVAALAVPAAGLTVLCFRDASNLGWFGMCLIAGWAAIGARFGPAVTAAAVLVAGFIAQWLMFGAQPWGAWIGGTVFVAMGGIFARRQRELLDQLRAAQAGLADRARAEERSRLASEMHDVIGHALTVSLLHVSSARLALDEDPAEARASLSEAERMARQSLSEVRATVGLMRTAGPDDSTEPAPMPTAADVAELVESFRRTGTHVEFEVVGDLKALGPTRGLAVYRIAQESLTNAARHGDGAPVTVRLEVEDHQTSLTVTNGGRPQHQARDVSEGAGLVGMRERAEAVGGQLLAGPDPGGWRVEAVLPW